MAYGLVGLSWAVLWMASRQVAFLLPLLVLLLAHPWLGRLFAPRIPWYVYALLLAPASWANRNVTLERLGGARFQTTFFIALLFLVWALLSLYRRRDPRRLPRLLLFCALCCASSAVGLAEVVGDSPRWFERSLLGPWTPRSPERFYAGAIALYTTLAVLASRRGLVRPRRDEQGGGLFLPAILALALAVVAALGWTGIVVARRHYQDLANWSTSLLRDAGPGSGFSGAGNLDSVSSQRAAAARRVCLRAVAARAPGYLRARVFARYAKGRWTESPGGEERLLPRAGWVALSPTEGRRAEALFLEPVGGDGATLFVPLEVASLRGGGAVRRRAGGGLLAEGWSPTGGYEVRLGGAAGGADDGAGWLDLPEDAGLVEALDATLATVGLAPGKAPAEAVRALEGWFRREFAYALGVRFPAGRDPLSAFLLGAERRGHCELFASAGTLLLRRLGVPARYVTGVVCCERSAPGSELWLARDRDAHAWVEYLAADGRWRTAEFTPPAGVPQGGGRAGTLEAWRHWLGSLWTRAKRWTREALSAVASELGPWTFVALALGAAAVVFARWVWGRRRPAVAVRAQRAGRPLCPPLAAQRQRFLALEARLRRRGLGRWAGETLLEYADRLARDPEAASSLHVEDLRFLRSFGRSRYGPTARGG